MACDALVDFHAWDPTKIDARGWLANFDIKDRALAESLLSRFSFYADHLVDQLFVSAFQNISNHIRPDGAPFEETRALWRAFCSTMLITPVQGEDPNPSDSGWLFARKARQTLNIDQAQLFNPAQAAARVAAGDAKAVVFVDDFVGSGEQFRRTWTRRHPTPDGGSVSFHEAAHAHPDAKFFYCNAMTTSHGLGRIRQAAPNVHVSAGNVIPGDHSLSSPQSALWSSDQRAKGIEMLRRVSFDLGYGEDGGGLNDWQGFHRLGLGLAFEHSVPDASLPIFFTDRNGWTPLVKRS